MAETLSTLSIISFVIAGVSFALAIVLFIYFRIPTVIGDLSGRNAKKSIARMREGNEKTGNKSYRTGAVNEVRGKLTATDPGIDSAKKSKKTDRNAAVSNNPETGLLAENRADLIGEATVPLDTTEETVLLAQTPAEPAKRIGGVKLTMIDDVMIIHTQEVIE